MVLLTFSAVYDCVAFYSAEAFNGDVSSWDVSQVTDMSESKWNGG